MSVANRATQKKRQRELAQRQNRQVKADKQAERKERKKERDTALSLDPNCDPDLMGIVPGPQPIQE